MKAPSRIEINRSVFAAKRGIVGHDDEGQTRGMERFEKTEHLEAGRAVQVARGFVGQKEPGLVDQRPGDRHPLALTPRQRRGEMVGAIGQPDLVERSGASDFLAVTPSRTRRCRR